MSSQSQGFVRLSMVVAITLGAGLLASAYLNYHQFDQAQQDRTLLQGQISDLQYQLKKVNQSPTPSPSASTSPSPSASPEASPTPTPAVSPTTTPQVAGATTSAATLKAQANLRKGPSASAALIAKLPGGTSVALGSGQRGDQYRQVVYDGQTGYVLDSYLQY